MSDVSTFVQLGEKAFFAISGDILLVKKKHAKG